MTNPPFRPPPFDLACIHRACHDRTNLTLRSAGRNKTQRTRIPSAPRPPRAPLATACSSVAHPSVPAPPAASLRHRCARTCSSRCAPNPSATLRIRLDDPGHTATGIPAGDREAIHDSRNTARIAAGPVAMPAGARRAAARWHRDDDTVRPREEGSLDCGCSVYVRTVVKQTDRDRR